MVARRRYRLELRDVPRILIAPPRRRNPVQRKAPRRRNPEQRKATPAAQSETTQGDPAAQSGTTQGDPGGAIRSNARRPGGAIRNNARRPRRRNLKQRKATTAPIVAYPFQARRVNENLTFSRRVFSLRLLEYPLKSLLLTS